LKYRPVLLAKWYDEEDDRYPLQVCLQPLLPEQLGQQSRAKKYYKAYCRTYNDIQVVEGGQLFNVRFFSLNNSVGNAQVEEDYGKIGDNQQETRHTEDLGREQTR
jgi:hypothetical protein